MSECIIIVYLGLLGLLSKQQSVFIHVLCQLLMLTYLNSNCSYVTQSLTIAVHVNIMASSALFLSLTFYW